MELATRLIWEQNAMQVKDIQDYGGWQLQLILDHLQYCVFSVTHVGVKLKLGKVDKSKNPAGEH